MAKIADRDAHISFFKEETQYMMEEHITTVTFYKGQLPLQFLETRINEIVVLNPWLNGRLVKQDGEIILKYTVEPVIPVLSSADSTACFRVIHVNDLPPEAHDSTENYFWMTRYIVEDAKKVVGKDKPLFLVHLVELSSDRCALVVSISHLLTDGHGFYQLYGMLSESSSARALNAVRDFQINAKMKEYTGASYQLFGSMGMICNMMGRFFFYKNAILHSRRINAHWIEKQKQDFAQHRGNEGSNVSSSSSPEFISTNDIITSHFFTAMKADIGMMAINFRNRIENLVNDHLANYEGAISYHPVDFASPALIRQSISSGKYLPVITGNNPICPGFFKRRKAKVGLITNWAGLYQHLSFEGCEHVLHSPVYAAMPPVMIVGVIYKTNATDTALLVFDNSTTIVDTLSSQGMVEEKNIKFTSELF